MLRFFDCRDNKGMALFREYLHGRRRSACDGVTETVSRIVRDVRDRGDVKLFEYTMIFDKVKLDPSNVRVPRSEMEKACRDADPRIVDIIRKAAANIRDFHEKQAVSGFFIDKGRGTKIGQIVRPLDNAGIYVPGGTAPLPSSVLMNAIPAKIAGVKRIIMATPPKKDGIDPLMLVAAMEAGVDEVYRIGGAQAIAAMAYGTESIPRVDKITGPGNKYVAAAKKEVFGVCDIDMTAGPSEICIIADGDSNIGYIAADMLSQAEHDEDASSVLVMIGDIPADVIENEIGKQLADLPRKDIAEKSLRDNGAVAYAKSIDQALEIAGMIAPEHLEMVFAGAGEHIDKVSNAGAVFIGEYSPEPVGDYFAGTNHVLPTGGSSRFFSPLGVYDFIKRMSYINYSKDDLEAEYEDIAGFAECEMMDAHARSVRIRFGGRDDR